CARPVHRPHLRRGAGAAAVRLRRRGARASGLAPRFSRNSTNLLHLLRSRGENCGRFVELWEIYRFVRRRTVCRAISHVNNTSHESANAPTRIGNGGGRKRTVTSLPSAASERSSVNR